MSFNQSKSEKNDADCRRTGRASSFNQQRGSYGRGAGGGGAGITPSGNSLFTSRSFNKKSNNAQGGQCRPNPSPGNSTESNSASVAWTINNGISNGPVTKSSELSAVHSSAGIVPKAPTSLHPPLISDPVPPTNVAKGDASKSFPFQFGSITPGFINGMAVPPRTSSAPPNLDEQKRDQAVHESYKSVPSVPIPPVPKQQQPPRKDAGVIEQSNADESQETHTGTKAKKDTQVSALSPASQMSKPSVPVTGISISTPYHQSQAPLQFGGANPQIQSQGMTTASLQMPMPMPLPIGNATQVQQPVFVPGLQTHPMHPQGILHQGPNMSFAPQMGPQLPHQLGSMGIGPKYPQQQGGKFAGPRKSTTIKITHPETHEELRLDKRTDAYQDGGSSSARSHSNMPSEPQHVKSFPPSHPVNYYSSSSYNTNSLYYPPNSLPLTSIPITPNSQPPIFTYPVNHAPQGGSFMNSSSLGSLPNNKASTPTGVSTIKKSGTSATVNSSLSNSSISDVQNGESPSLKKGSETCSEISLQQSNLSSDSAPVVTNNESRRESISRSNSLKDKKPGKKGQLSQHQVSELSPAVDNVPSHVVDHGISHTGVSEPAVTKTDHSAAISTVDLPISDTISRSASTVVEGKTKESAEVYACVSAQGSSAQTVDKVTNRNPDMIDKLAEENFGTSDLQSADLPETTTKHVKDGSENAVGESDTKDRPIIEPNKAKTTYKGKKKRREILQKADAAGSTSDLYNAYKGPEEKKETVLSSESTDSATTITRSLKQLPKDESQSHAVANEKCGHGKAELDDWEDAADMSTPNLEVHDKSPQVGDGSGSTVKKYSRDFLIKFAEHCTDLPEGFEISLDIAEVLTSVNIGGSHGFERDSHPSPGRIVDRSGGMSRMDRRGDVLMEDDRWNKVSGGFRSARGLDGIGGNMGFRSGQGGNFGVLRNPRAQTPLQSAAGGILSGPMQSVGNQGGRNTPDGERWQRSASFQQRGLIPSPTQAPLQMMHKAEKKYEVGKVTDEEEVKQRQLKAILNKLTPQNFDRLFQQVKAVNIDNAVTLTGVISQIFEKALMEPTFCEMYANFCFHLAYELPDFSEDNEKITFKRLLLNKCQEEFERGEREEEEANKADEGEVKQSAEEREERRVKARRRMLGNIRLIGELYKKKMLTERIMHECIKKLLGQCQDPDEEDIEALCKLMSTIGEMIDHPKAKEHMDAYYERMKLLSNNMNLSSRVRFMLKDAIDLRKNKWQQRRKVEGPKKIEEVHRDAAQERQAQSGRLGRGLGNNQSARRNPMDFGPRGSVLPSPNAQMGGPRALPTQGRGFGSQDARFEERQSYETRTLSVPLTQRPLGDDSITLGPQGGLARGMSIRGSTANSNFPTSDVHPVPGDSHRVTTGLNGHSNLSERTTNSSRADLVSRYGTDRSSGPSAYDQSNAAERNVNHGNRDLRNADQNHDRLVATSPPAQLQGSIVSQSTSETIWPEEKLRNMSLSAIREYYSAKDEKELALCIKDLNAPSFHPSMVSLWVTDSFERKDTERDLLAKLLVNLVKSQHGTLSQLQLIKGFASVLSTLEDAVNDAPRAAEFLGRIFAEAITENVATLDEIARLIHDGGEEPGSLIEVGLAADVLGSTLEVVQIEKGDAVLNEMRSSSSLRLETFRPRNAKASRKLEKFI